MCTPLGYRAPEVSALFTGFRSASVRTARGVVRGQSQAAAERARTAARAHRRRQAEAQCAHTIQSAARQGPQVRLSTNVYLHTQLYLLNLTYIYYISANISPPIYLLAFHNYISDL